MKSRLFFLSVVLAFSQSHAAPIASDSFANTAGGADYDINSLRNQTATVGTTGYVAGNSWIRNTGAIYNTSGGLTHPMTPGTVLEGRIIAYSSNNTAGRAQIRQLDYTPATGSYYFSALFQKNPATTTHDLLAGVTGAIGADNGAYTLGADFMMGLYNGGFSVAVPGVGFTELVTAANLVVGETYFGLMEISYSSTGSDSATVKVYNSSSAEVASQTFTGLDLSLGYFAFATNNYGPNVSADEFRYGTDLSDVRILGAPTVSGIEDDQLIDTVVQGTLVTYTVTFSQDMNDTTVDATDFGNAGTIASYTIGTVTETSPGVFSVPVTPNEAGTLQLQINQSAILTNAFGNNLDTSAAILDDTTFTVTLTDDIDPTLIDIVDDKDGGPVTAGTLVTYTVSFSEDMDDATVAADDFGNAGTIASYTVGTVTETAPGVFTVPVTPNETGTLQLQINQSAILSDTAGNNFDTASAILDNAVISVVDLDAAIVAYYPFDGNYDDASGNGNNGTLVDVGTNGNSGISTTAGEWKFGGGALDVSSDADYVSIPAINLVTDANGWSVAFWARDRNAVKNQDGMAIGDASNTTDFIWVDAQFGGMRARMNSSTFTADYNLPAEDTSWHHYVLVAEDGDNDTSFDDLTLYRDGAPVATQLNQAGASFNITAIGSAYNTLNYDFDGQIDEVYIYDIAIDAAKVAELYAGTPDETPPTLVDIVDDRASGPVEPGSTVTYTVSFNEDMDNSTVEAADFGNAGSIVSYTIGTVTETSPGVFSVPVTPNATGTLQLQINQSAILSDTSGNDLDTATAILDDTVITVEADNTNPTLATGDFQDDQGGGPVTQGTTVTFTITFSEDIDDSTVDASDFGNEGTADVTIGSITEVSPGVFEVQVTPNTSGTLQLKVLSGAEIADAAGNLLDTSSAIVSDTVITVQEGFSPAGVRRLIVVLLGGQSNMEGRADSSGLPTSPVNLQLPQDDVDFFYKGGGGTLTTLRPGLSDSGQFGPEVTIGRRLADELTDGITTRVALVKYSRGGTNLHTQWAAGGDATTTGDGSEYAIFQQTVTNGLAALAVKYPNAVIELKGMVWLQGESDSGAEAVNYETNLTNFIADVRLTYGADLPFVVIRLSDGQTAVGSLTTIQNAQTAVAAADPLTGLVDSDGFGMKTDNLHFDALGQQQNGDASAIQLLNFCPFLRPLQIEAPAGGNVALTIDDAFEEFVYTLRSSDTLQAGDWILEEAKTATGDTVDFTVTPTPGEDRRFYRVERTIAP